jgi:hypothetical protein
MSRSGHTPMCSTSAVTPPAISVSGARVRGGAAAAQTVGYLTGNPRVASASIMRRTLFGDAKRRKMCAAITKRRTVSSARRPCEKERLRPRCRVRDPAARTLLRAMSSGSVRPRRGGANHRLCDAHAGRWQRVRYKLRSPLSFDEWCRTGSPVSDGCRVVFAGLDPHVAKQILYGIFNRSRRGSYTRLQSLQRVVDFVRQFEPTDLNLIF